MLVELSVMEQRYHAVMEVISGAPVAEVGRRYGVSRRAVHGWLGRYEREGLAGLADRSHRPAHQPRQLDAGIEALICQLRGSHPRWGPRRLLFELGKAKVRPLPSRSTIYRVLVRHGVVAARKRKRRRQDYKRWQREEPMQLWQLDITGSVFLADGTELKLISGIDDHSRFCVIAAVVRRATARAVCRAFIAAMRAYGIPDEVLTDNGKQFTGRRTSRPVPASRGPAPEETRSPASWPATPDATSLPRSASSPATCSPSSPNGHAWASSPRPAPDGTRSPPRPAPRPMRDRNP